MFAKPQSEHKWLTQLVGIWSFDHNCDGPDGEKTQSSGTMECRMLGGLWVICESSGGETEDGKWSAIMTLGFDPAKNAYVGTFVGSMMNNIWPYQGVLDETGKRLTLNSEGPKFDGEGTGLYRDTIEIVDPDQWLMISEMQGDQGEWTQFMRGVHKRR